MKKPIRTAVFPVAGMGTRFLPATKAIPKEMLVVGDKPLVQHAVEEAKWAGIERFVFVTSQGKAAIEDHFDTNPVLEHLLLDRGKKRELEIVHSTCIDPGMAICIRQQLPLGLGHAVWCARNMIGNEPFALILSDDMILSEKACLAQMIEAYEEKGGGNFAAVMEVPQEQVSRYGILDIEADDGRIVKAKKVVEKPAAEKSPSRTAIVGRYILQPEVLRFLALHKTGAGGEIQLTDAFNPLMKHSPFYGVRFKGERFDCGTKEGWLEANLALAYSQPERREKLKESIAKYCR